MRRFVLTVLASLGVAAALTVTASSTTEQAHVAGMVGLPVAGLVVLLEVVNVVGAWSWITDPRTHVRWESALAVLVASTVTGICGAITYGPLGVVAPLGLLAAVHGVSRMWTVPAQVAAPSVPVASMPVRRHTGTPVSAPEVETEVEDEVEPTSPPPPDLRPAPAPVDLDALAAPQVDEVEDEEDDEGDWGPAQQVDLDPAPAPAQVRPPSDQGSDPGLTDEEIVAVLIALPGDLPPRDTVKGVYRVGTKRATRLLDLAREGRRPHLVKETP